MTVLDTSVVVDSLLGVGRFDVAEHAPAAAPDLLVFEVLAVLRRTVARGELRPARARAALEDLGDLAIELFPALPLGERAFELRENLTAGDALFVALAEALDEPLATKDSALARAANEQSRAEVLLVR